MSVPRDRGIVKSRMIEAVSQAGTDRDRGPIEVSAERVRDFVAHYLDHVPVTDLEQMDPDSLVQILESHFRLASRREPGTDLVQVTTPAGDDQWHLGESTLQPPRLVVAAGAPSAVPGGTKQGRAADRPGAPQSRGAGGNSGVLDDLCGVSAAGS